MPYSRFAASLNRSLLRHTVFRFLVLSIIVAALSVSFFSQGAEASVVDKVKSWLELPSQVDELKSQYDTTKQQLESAAKQIDEAARQSKETTEQYRQAEQQLRDENERLVKQNEQLALAVKGLQDAEKLRADRSRRTWTIIWTAVGLVALYFLSSRLFRLVLRSKRF